MSNFQTARRDVCWYCGGRLVWGNDYSPEDLGYDEGTDGIVSHLTCMDCGAFGRISKSGRRASACTVRAGFYGRRAFSRRGRRN